MAISINFNRPKLETTLQEVVTLTATLTEEVANKIYVMDVKYTVTTDLGASVIKVLKRIKVTPVLVGTSMRLDFVELTFPPTAIENPLDAAAISTSPVTRGGSQIDLDTFLTGTGDLRKNTNI